LNGPAQHGMSRAAPHDVDADRSPIFVVGAARSGTTLLRMMLNAHPRIYLTHEASFYLTMRGPARGMAGRQWLERYVSTFSFKWLRLAAGPLFARLPADAPIEEAVRLVMKTKAERYGKSRFGDKTPLHAMCLKQIFADFPDAKVIHLVRDPRDTVASLDRMPWATSSTALNGFYVELQIRAVAHFRDRIHVARFEDLLADPRRVLRAILEYVGEPWDDAVLDHEHHIARDDVPPFPWFLSAMTNLRPHAEEPAYLRQFGPEWIRVIESMSAFTMRRYGYSPAVLGREPSHLERARVVLRETGEIGRSLWRLLRYHSLTRRKPPPDAEEVMHALLHINPQAWNQNPGLQMPAIPPPEG
jgi:hypothetical protein